MSQTIKYLNGDAGLFFRNKINAIPLEKDVLKYINKRIGKKFTVSAITSYKGELSRRYRHFFIESYKIIDNKIRLYTKSDLSPIIHTVDVHFYDITEGTKSGLIMTMQY